MNNKRSIYITTNVTCNLNCMYCYEKDKSNHTTFDVNKAIQTIESVLNVKSDDNVYINFHGGEPFLVFDKIRTVCEYIWKRSYPTKYIFFTTSNGTLVKGEIKEWLYQNRHKFVVGLSLDGTKQMHDINRSDSFDKIDIPFFLDAWPNQGIKMTISPLTIRHLSEGVIFLHDIGIKAINVNLAEMIDWSDEKLLIYYKDELHKLALYYKTHPTIQRCSLFRINFANLNKSNIEKWCGAGTSMAVADIDGRTYPCHLFFESVCGKEKSEAARNFDFTDISKLVSKDCKECCLLPLCPTCLGSNYIARGNIAARDMHLCKYTKIRIAEVAWLEYSLIIDDSVNIAQLTDSEKYKRLKTLEGIEKILPFLNHQIE